MKLDNITKFMLKWKWLIAFIITVTGIFIYTGQKEVKTNDIPEIKRTDITMNGKHVDVSDIELVNIKGEKINILKKATKERTLFIYAAEWCEHCRKFLPVVENFKQVYGNKYNVIVVFSGTSTKEAVIKYVSENKFTFDWYYDDNMVISDKLFIQGVPFPVILEKYDSRLIMRYYLTERENILEIEKAMSK